MYFNQMQALSATRSIAKVLYTPTLDGKKIIANCFGQDGYGGKATVYPALESALQQVATKAKKQEHLLRYLD